MTSRSLKDTRILTELELAMTRSKKPYAKVYALKLEIPNVYEFSRRFKTINIYLIEGKNIGW
jgi:hypothetical protein